MKNINQIQNSKGFTLIELLITVAISGIVLLLVTQVFMSTNKMNTIQENVAAVQQDVRAAMDIMSMDIMMAGFDPDPTLHPSLPSDAGFLNKGGDDNTDRDSIALKYYYEGDGTNIIDKCYYYDSDKECLRIRNGGAVRSLTADDTISKVNFSYTLADGSVATDPTDSQLADIRLVTVEICGKITGAYKADHTKTYCFSRNIKPRNM